MLAWGQWAMMMVACVSAAGAMSAKDRSTFQMGISLHREVSALARGCMGAWVHGWGAYAMHSTPQAAWHC